MTRATTPQDATMGIRSKRVPIMTSSPLVSTVSRWNWDALLQLDSRANFHNPFSWGLSSATCRPVTSRYVSGIVRMGGMRTMMTARMMPMTQMQR